MSVVVRRATRDDAAKIGELAIALFDLHVGWNPRRFTQIATVEGAASFYGGQTEADDAAVFVAEVGGDVMGFAYAAYEALDYAGLLVNAMLLHDIYVAEPARGHGVGKFLVDAVRDEAARRGADKVILSVAVQNEPGRRLFEECGFAMSMQEMMLIV